MGRKVCRAKDIMTTEVVCVHTGTSLRELETIFLEKGITGAPVVDDAGCLVGVISQTDLIHYHLTRGDRPARESDSYRRAEPEATFARSEIDDYDVGRVREMMTPVVHTVAPETPVEDLARLMAVARIHRVIVTADRKVVGLVSAMDLLKVIAPRKRAPAARTDRALGA